MVGSTGLVFWALAKPRVRLVARRKMVFIEGELNARTGGILTGELFGMPVADDWLV